jgi:hypothetical protein
MQRKKPDAIITNDKKRLLSIYRTKIFSTENPILTEDGEELRVVFRPNENKKRLRETDKKLSHQ